jgi:hypothetical protein
MALQTSQREESRSPGSLFDDSHSSMSHLWLLYSAEMSGFRIRMCLLYLNEMFVAIQQSSVIYANTSIQAEAPTSRECSENSKKT